MPGITIELAGKSYQLPPLPETRFRDLELCYEELESYAEFDGPDAAQDLIDCYADLRRSFFWCIMDAGQNISPQELRACDPVEVIVAANDWLDASSEFTEALESTRPN